MCFSQAWALQASPNASGGISPSAFASLNSARAFSKSIPLSATSCMACLNLCCRWKRWIDSDWLQGVAQDWGKEGRGHEMKQIQLPGTLRFKYSLLYSKPRIFRYDIPAAAPTESSLSQWSLILLMGVAAKVEGSASGIAAPPIWIKDYRYINTSYMYACILYTCIRVKNHGYKIVQIGFISFLWKGT